MRTIDSIIIHCSDSPESMDIGFEEIDFWHRTRAKNGEPWFTYTDGGITMYAGYHYIVRRNGVVEDARPVTVMGCHCRGMNKSSIGICWVGRDKMTAGQKEALVSLVSRLCVEFSLNSSDVFGHCQYSSKTCPNFNSSATFESMDAFRQVVDVAIKTIK